MKVSEIRDILKATVVAGNDQMNKSVVAAGGWHTPFTDTGVASGLRGLDGSC